MVNRMAAVAALLVFAVCLVVGGLGADNPSPPPSSGL